MKYIYLLTLPLALASLACLETAMQAPAPSAVPAASLSPNPTPPEPESGTVFELIAESQTPKAKQCAIVTAIQALNLRAEPSEFGTVIGWLRAGQTVTIQFKAGAWFYVQAETISGYARADYLKEMECE